MHKKLHFHSNKKNILFWPHLKKYFIILTLLNFSRDSALSHNTLQICYNISWLCSNEIKSNPITNVMVSHHLWYRKIILENSTPKKWDCDWELQTTGSFANYDLSVVNDFPLFVFDLDSSIFCFVQYLTKKNQELEFISQSNSKKGFWEVWLGDWRASQFIEV